MGMRYYRFGEKKLPSVTSITSLIPNPFLEKWRRETPNAQEISERAMTIGTLFHYRVETWLAEKYKLPPPQLESVKKELIDKKAMDSLEVMWLQFETFIKDYSIEPHLVEAVVVNHSKGYAGRIDIVATIDYELWILDIKTGKYIYDDYEAQLAAYSDCPIDGFRTYTGPIHIAIMKFNPTTGQQFKELDRVKGRESFERAKIQYDNIAEMCDNGHNCATCRQDKRCPIYAEQVIG